MEYQHLFKTKSEHEAFYYGDKYKEPWSAYIKDDKLVTYNRPYDYSKDYFTIEALDDGNVYFKYLQFAPTNDQRYIEYSKDNGQTWVRTTNVDNNEVVMNIPLLTGERALVRGDNDTFSAYNDDEGDWFSSFFYSDIEFNVSGNIMSLIYSDNFIGETNVVEYMFIYLFCDSWGLYNGAGSTDCIVVNAKNLILPTTLADHCYYQMFSGCTSLTTVPELPATTLAQYCYNSMFSGCTSLTTTPELPATTLAQYCYSGMFNGCTSLTTTPELPATTLAQHCYSGMFNRCTSLTSVPELPATTLAPYCYNAMFSGCTSLTTTSELPATTLAQYCYSGMFKGCTSLTSTYELPATTLTQYCYYQMFQDCTSLITGPELHATTLTQGCYESMFNGCTNLNYIKAMFTTTPSTRYTDSWVKNVASTGTFIKNKAAQWNVTGVNGIPTGWTVETASA